MKSFGGVELLGSITIVANFVFTKGFIGWGFVMEDCIRFYMYNTRILFPNRGHKYKIEST
jgi:hypothetical protein